MYNTQVIVRRCDLYMTVQVQAFSGKYSESTPDSLLPSFGHPADDVQDPGFVQVRDFLMIDV